MGEVFGKYELVRRIGVGGMAEVFEARGHGAAGFIKEMVIKRILPVFNEDPDFVNLFIKEARLAARLTHANIVQIFDFNQVDGIHYIAMEWVHGQDLSRICQASRRRDMPLSGNLAAYVGMEVLKGLHYAHTRLDGGSPMGLVHRDISPHNILISFAGEVKIADFGIAKVAALASTVRSGGSIKGKLPYMSPEQVNAREVDARSDLFSLGIVLWELLTGRRLYQGGTEAEIFAQVQRADIPRPTAFISGIPRDLETVVMDLLAPDRHRRYQSAHEALSDLGQFAGHEDPLETGEFLTRLLPEEAQRDRRGQTEVQTGDSGRQQEPSPAQVADQAPVSGEAMVPRILPDRAPSPSNPPPVNTPRPPGRPEQKGGRRLAAAALICFLLAGLASWLLVRRSGDTPAPGTSIPTKEEISSLTLRTAEGGSAIMVEGVRLGSDPVRIHGPRGGRLQVQAGEGEAAKAVMGESGQVLLPSHAPAAPIIRDMDTPADMRRPDMGTPPPVVTRRDPELRGGRPTPRPVKPGGRSGRPTSNRGAAGQLDVFVSPWAQVHVDGRDVGQTPVKSLRLTPGRHRVELHNPNLGRRERVMVTIQSGKRAPPIKRIWDE